MTVPPLPRDCASRPLLGKEEGSAKDVTEEKRIMADERVRMRAKVFMFLLIYVERVGVKRAECGMENVEYGNRKTLGMSSITASSLTGLFHMLHSAFYVLHIRCDIEPHLIC
jgi:hypothetical protein